MADEKTPAHGLHGKDRRQGDLRDVVIHGVDTDTRSCDGGCVPYVGLHLLQSARRIFEPVEVQHPHLTPLHAQPAGQQAPEEARPPGHQLGHQVCPRSRIQAMLRRIPSARSIFGR